jgi:AcrR family transcriptional regulator
MSSESRKQSGVGGKAAATRLRLLDAAARVLGQNGYAGMRLVDVGEVAGVQAPAIYYHFRSKEEMAGEVLREGLVRSRRYLLDSLSEHEGAHPMDRLGVAIEAHLRIATERSDYAAAASLRTSGEIPPAIQGLCRPDERAYARVWKGLLTEAKEAGLLRDQIEVSTAQLMLLGALNAIADSWKPGQRDVDSVARTAILMLLNGLSEHVSARSDATERVG